MYQLVVYVHILAAMVWVGGMLFLALVVVPATRGLEPARREAVFEAVGRRFRAVGWACLALLVVTGGLNLWFRRVDPFSAALYASPFGRVLAAKLVAVAAMAGLVAYHDVVRAGRRAQLSARLAAFVGVIVVGLAVLLVRGVPG